MNLHTGNYLIFSHWLIDSRWAREIIKVRSGRSESHDIMPLLYRIVSMLHELGSTWDFIRSVLVHFCSLRPDLTPLASTTNWGEFWTCHTGMADLGSKWVRMTSQNILKSESDLLKVLNLRKLFSRPYFCWGTYFHKIKIRYRPRTNGDGTNYTN